MAPHDLWDLNLIYQPTWWMHYIEIFSQLEWELFSEEGGDLSQATDEELAEMGYASTEEESDDDDDVEVLT